MKNTKLTTKNNLDFQRERNCDQTSWNKRIKDSPTRGRPACKRQSVSEITIALVNVLAIKITTQKNLGCDWSPSWMSWSKNFPIVIDWTKKNCKRKVCDSFERSNILRILTPKFAKVTRQNAYLSIDTRFETWSRNKHCSKCLAFYRHIMWSFSNISLIWLYRVQVVHIRGKGKIEQERNLSSWRSFNRFLSL